MLRPGLDTDEILHRLRQERQILAGLEHPNIARLLDAALTDDGLPAIVMEYVEGVPIDRYVSEHELSIADRLELFRTICSAVGAAHRSLIVHRDLKPSNVLVTAEGVPKLLDFGIAKPLDPSSFPQTVVPTELSWRPMTPDYASPEQVRGGAITTASDVYSLGVLLYLLLTGERPYRVDPGRPAEMERLICEVEPPRPSAQAPEKLRRQLLGDLDTLVSKAMAKEPTRRYSTVDRLSEDVRRHLQGRPILARPPTLRYRAGKFIRRHRAGVAMASTSLFLLLAGGVATAWQAHVARLEGVRAEAERERAEQVSGFLEELFQVADRSTVQGEAITARELLDRGAERLSAGLDDQPEVRARLLDTVGFSYQGLGFYDEAKRFLEEALRLRRESLGPFDLEVAESLDHLAGLQQARGEFAAAEAHAREALGIRRQILGPKDRLVSESLNNLAEALRARGELEAAEPLLREALEMKLELLGEEHPSVAVGLNNLAGVHAARGDYSAAEPLFARALELRRRLLGPEAPAVAESLNNLGLVRFRQGDYAGAEEVLREALELRRRLHGGKHPAVARSQGNLAAALLARGDHRAAEPLLREALEIKRQFLAEGHPSLVVSVLALGQLLLDLGDLDGAGPLLGEALEPRRRLEPGDWRRAEAEAAWGAWAVAAGRPAEGEKALAEGCRVLIAELGTEDRRTRRRCGSGAGEAVTGAGG